MIITFLFFWFTLNVYFHAMQASQKPIAEISLFSRGAFMTMYQNWRVTLALVPLAVSWFGYKLESNLPQCSIALTVLISPLWIRTPLKPTAEDSQHFLVFAFKWLMDFLHGTVFIAVIFGIIRLLYYLPFVPPEASFTEMIDNLFYIPTVTPIASRLVMPFSFYLVCIIVLMWRIGRLQKGRLWYGMVGAISGYIALFYFHYLTTQIPLTTSNWKAPIAGGILMGLVFRLFTAYQLATQELESKNLSRTP